MISETVHQGVYDSLAVQHHQHTVAYENARPLSI